MTPFLQILYNVFINHFFKVTLSLQAMMDVFLTMCKFLVITTYQLWFCEIT